VTDRFPDDEDGGTGPEGSVAQAEIRRLRQSVLSGRGPGVSRSEFLRHTRGRAVVGGRPVARQREAVAREAAAARRDADGLLLHVVAARSRLDSDVDELRDRTVRQRGKGRVSGPRKRLARSRGTRLAVVGLAAALAGRSMWRRSR